MTPRLTACVLLMCSAIACEASSTPAPDASAPADTGTPDDPEDASVPGSFSIQLSRTVCFGDCPSFDLQIDAQGHVRYWGDFCVERFGAFEADIGKDAAATLYRELRHAGLWDWVGTAPSECNVADTSIQIWELTVEGGTDMARFNPACADAERMKALQTRVTSATGASRWIGEAEFNCGYRQEDQLADGAFELRDSTGALGILTLTDSRTWSLTDCEDTPVADGRVVFDGHDAVLLPEERSLMPWAGAPKAHSATLPLGDLDGASIRVDGTQGEVTQTLQDSMACAP